MIEQRVTLRYDAQQIPAIVQAVQGDTGRDVIFELADYEIPAGATANYYIDKPDGNAVYNSAEVISSTEIRAHLTEQALAVPGRNNGQVRILSDGEVITSFDFVLEVEAFRGIMRLQSETEVNIFDEALQEAADDAIQEILDQTPVVTGMQNSIAPSYSSSSTYAVGDYVMYNAQLYRCITAITTAEAWTAAHWTQVPLADDVNDLKSALIETESLFIDGFYKIYPLAGYLNYAGRITDDGETSYATSVIYCSEGDVYHYSGAFGGNAVACIFLNGNTVVDFVTKNTYSQTEIDITVPSGVNAIRFGGYHTKQEIYKKGNLFDLTRNVGLSPLDGSKKWYAFGDSFTHGDFTGYVDANGYSGTESDAYDPNFSGGMYKTWAYWIAKRHKMKLSNLAVNGAKTTYMTTDKLYVNVPSDCDYVTFMLGLNDTSSSGDIDSTDPTTWHGAWNVVLNWMRLYRPKTKLGIIIPPSWLGNSWRVEIEAVAKRHGVPVLNLYSDPKAPALLGNLSGTLLAKKDMDSTISARVTANNVVKSTEPVNEHPNLACFEQMSHIIEGFMQVL